MPSDTQDPTKTLRPSNTAGSTDIPQLTNTTRPADTPTPSLLAGIESSQTVVPDSDLATVTYVVDGDTIDVAIGGTTYRVRSICMDTLERGNYFFSEATEANRVLVEGQQVILVKDISTGTAVCRGMYISKTAPSSMPNWSGKVTQSSQPSHPVSGIRRCFWNCNRKRGRQAGGCGRNPHTLIRHHLTRSRQLSRRRRMSRFQPNEPV